MSIVVHGPRSGAEEADEFPTREDLADVLERVHTEIGVLRLLVRQIELRDALASHMVTALRESLLLRVFRLRHFFYGRAEETWELVASDYFRDPDDWTSVRPPAPPHLSRWLNDLLVWVVDRVYADPDGRVPEEAWPLASSVEALASTHKVFCEAIVDHHEKPLVNLPWSQESEEDIVSNLSDSAPSSEASAPPRGSDDDSSGTRPEST